MGTEDGDTAAARLRQLHEHLQHPVTGRAERAAPSPRPGAPVNLDVIDHISRCVTEVVEHTRAANPDAGPLPARVEAVYQWCRENTKYADGVVPQRTATIEYRHRLEHAVRAGDGKIVRPHRCPSCGTLGLHWQAAIQRAMCLNIHCAKRNGGTHRTWTLAKLAHEHVAAETMLRDCAT